MNGALNQHYLFIIVFLILGLVTVIANYLTVHRFDQYASSSEFPRVSVLVPARNEGHNIETCVSSLLAQEYPDFEVIVLNDNSVDDTQQILSRLARTEGQLRVLEGRPLPEGWLGKHWACHQLAQAATGDLLLFTDADTRHFPHMLRDSVSALLAERSDLVTAFPRELVLTWGERLLIPFIGFGIFAFLPIRLIQRLRWSAVSITIGQFMLFRREAYEAVGGFEAVRSHIVDDISLGRKIIDQGFQWRLMDGTEHLVCRMYRGFFESVEGLSKSLFAVFDFRILPYLLGWLVVSVAFLEPPLTLLSWWFGYPLTTMPPDLAAVAVVLGFSLCWLAFHRFKFPAYLAFFYPIILSLFMLVALLSFVQTLRGTATWKDRQLDRAAVRWL